MPRSKEFEPSVAVDRAMALFWEAGFSGASLDRLVDHTSASRYGLYATFGSKDNLLAHALDRYREQVVSPLFAPLERADAALPEVREVFVGIVRLIKDSGRRGCLNCNTAFEIGQSRSAAAKRVGRHFERLQSLMRKALRNAREAGQLRDDVDERRHSQFLVATAAGAFLLARAEMPEDMVVAFVRSAVAALGGTP